MPDDKTLIESKSKAMAVALNKAVTTKRDLKVAALRTEDAKAAKASSSAKDAKPPLDPDKRVNIVSFAVSTFTSSSKRTGLQQAAEVASQKSWTCSSGHMTDAARHVGMYYTEPGKPRKLANKGADPFGTDEKHFMTFAEFKAEWTNQMAAQGLKNYKAQDGYADGDVYHVELPESRLSRTSGEVQKCLVEYVRLTRDVGKPINKTFEKDWKAELKPHVDAAEAKKKKK